MFKVSCVNRKYLLLLASMSILNSVVVCAQQSQSTQAAQQRAQQSVQPQQTPSDIPPSQRLRTSVDWGAQPGDRVGLAGDYNLVLGPLGGTGTDGTGSRFYRGSAMAGGQAELAYNQQWGRGATSHFLLLDGRGLLMLGGGVEGRNTAGSSIIPLFQLRFIGALTLGMQAWRVLPLNVSVEDIDIRIDNGNDIRARALLGATIALPVNLLANMRSSQVLYIAATVGARTASDTMGDTPVAIQPRIRYITPRFSGDLRALFSLNGPSEERRAILSLGFNNLIGQGDQLGAYLAHGTWNDVGGQRVNLTEALIFYGGNFPTRGVSQNSTIEQRWE